jgi:AraC family transcriptional regulator of adaptative response/methylated-DNA-[protein]-cysteine methyltransferase
MDFQEQYAALLRSDPAYEGRFFVGVKTTGVFCRPTCRARKPHAVNCEFYSSTQEALAAGFRPCKLCHPLETAEPVPAMIAELLNEVGRAGVHVRDDELRRRRLDPDTVRRWFKRHHGLTFQGYQRARRLGLALTQLRDGSSVAMTAQDAGFDSLSGFGDAFKKRFGGSPSFTSAKVLWVTRLSTPLGAVMAGSVDGRLCLLEFADRPSLDRELLDLEKRLEARAVPGSDPVLTNLSDQLDRYFAGTLHTFNIPLELSGTPFQQAAWNALLTIPYAQTSSYRDQAVLCGRSGAIRAIGTANGANRIAIVVPCHRVVGSDGGLAGYRSGLWRKQWLLDHESRMRDSGV